MPEDVQEAFDSMITAVQNSKPVKAGARTDLKGKLEGISELGFDYRGDTYRTYYAAEFREVIFILSAGSKKSHKGGEIPKEEVEALEKRLKKAVAYYADNKEFFEARFARRARNREIERRQFEKGGSK
nr:type II toxin-antitoxin system RelE/ParE family toxin [Agrobacterium tumefaciens]